jgi:alpha-L-fucosidase
MGAWLRRNGESIYGTRGGPVSPQSWGVTTTKGNRVYLHVLDPSGETLSLPRLPRRVASARLFADKRKIGYTQNESGVQLKLPARAADDFDTIVVLELARR